MLNPQTLRRTERIGPFIQTYLGIRFYPVDPYLDDIQIEDIAHALSNQCRFTGHTKHFYSVAQHSVYCSQMMPPGQELYGLLHDASEAYLCDVARPVKHMPEMAEYRAVECVVQQWIYHRFGLGWQEPPELKKVDARMLFTEKEQLMAPLDWGYQVQPYDFEIQKMMPEEAEHAFLMRFIELTV